MLGWLAKIIDPGRDVDELARRLGVGAGDLASLTPSYRSFTLAKRSGGARVIHAPDEVLKRVQRLILRRVLANLRAHPAVMGFERGRSIVTHADTHVGRAVVIRLDVMEFFPSTRVDRVYAYFRFIGWNRKASRLLTALTTHRGGLPQGAPTSPRLSSLVNYRMDARLAAMVRVVGGERARYTRYADDLTFSLSEEHAGDVAGIIRRASAIVRDEGYFLHRKKKTHILRAHQRQIVTGLVVNVQASLPRETRRWLRAVEHRERLGKQTSISPAQLDGWRGMLSMIDRQRNSSAAATDR